MCHFSAGSNVTRKNVGCGSKILTFSTGSNVVSGTRHSRSINELLEPQYLTKFIMEYIFLKFLGSSLSRKNSTMRQRTLLHLYPRISPRRVSRLQSPGSRARMRERVAVLSAHILTQRPLPRFIAGTYGTRIIRICASASRFRGVALCARARQILFSLVHIIYAENLSRGLRTPRRPSRSPLQRRVRESEISRVETPRARGSARSVVITWRTSSYSSSSPPRVRCLQVQPGPRSCRA